MPRVGCGAQCPATRRYTYPPACRAPGRAAITRTRAGARTCEPERRDEAVTGAHQPGDGEQAGNDPVPTILPVVLLVVLDPNSEPTRSSPATSNSAAAMAPSTTRPVHRRRRQGECVEQPCPLAHGRQVDHGAPIHCRRITPGTTKDPAPDSTEDHSPPTACSRSSKACDYADLIDAATHQKPTRTRLLGPTTKDVSGLSRGRD